MHITNVSSQTCTYKDLKTGDCFRFANEDRHQVWIKTDLRDMAVDIRTGMLKVDVGEEAEIVRHEPRTIISIRIGEK